MAHVCNLQLSRLQHDGPNAPVLLVVRKIILELPLTASSGGSISVPAAGCGCWRGHPCSRVALGYTVVGRGGGLVLVACAHAITRVTHAGRTKARRSLENGIGRCIAALEQSSTDQCGPISVGARALW